MAEVDDEYIWKVVEPRGLALAIAATTIAFGALTTIVMGMRIFIRIKTHNFGTDDWVMLCGYVSLPTCANKSSYVIMSWSPFLTRRLSLSLPLEYSWSTWDKVPSPSMARTPASARLTDVSTKAPR